MALASAKVERAALTELFHDKETLCWHDYLQEVFEIPWT